MLNIRLHRIEALDNLLFVDIPTYEGTFFQISSMLKRPYNKNKFPGELFRCSLFLQKESILHKREIFNFLDLIGDLGGVIEVMVLIFGFIFFPISQQSFIHKLTKLMFKARTSNSDIFKKPKSEI